MDSKDVDYDKSYLKTIGKIFDLKAVDISSSKLVIEFTEPDYGVKSNQFQIVYDVRFSFYFKDVLDNFDTMTNKLILNNTIQTNNYGMVQSISINLPQELMLMNRVIYIALRPIVEQISGPISNIIRAEIPKNDVVSPSENSSEDPVDWNKSEEVVDDNLNLSGFVIPIVVFGILLLLSICCCVFYCCSKKKSTNKSQKQKDYNGMVWHSQINTVKVPTPVHNSEYSEYDRNSVLNTSYPDQYHTVGIPLPTNEQIREDPLCYDDAMHNLKCQQPYDCCDGDISKISEPVWASYLLSEYAKKQNLLGIDRNGILYDESEKGSYHEHIGLPVVDNYNPNDFGYYQSSLSMPFGSLQSVDNNERKIRNITMV